MSPALDQPILFERIFKEKIWGGRALEKTPGIRLPGATRVGETWEVVDRAEHNSRVARGGPLGRSLAELMQEAPIDLLGKAPAGPDGRFPLLVKYIDATENLSVQVHPDDAAARRIGGAAEAKTEAWYILEAAPGAVIYCGLKPGVEREGFERAGRAGEPVVEQLSRWEVRPGQCMLVPGGTVHAIGAGITLLEVQQSSDTTYRIYDWGRKGEDGQARPIRMREAMLSIEFGAPERPPIDPIFEQTKSGHRRAPLARSRAFGMNLLEFGSPGRLSTGGQFQIYVVVRGRGSLKLRESSATCALEPGDAWLVPAAADYHYIEPAPGGLALIQVLHKA